MHLDAASQMLPVLASAGHYNILKALMIYLHKMEELKTTHPNLHMKFATDGLQVVRRSEKAWSGVESDCIIEQTLMRSLKSVGGLTRGRGVDDVQRDIWLKSQPIW